MVVTAPTLKNTQGGRNGKGRQRRKLLLIGIIRRTAQGNVLALLTGLSNITFARDTITRLGTCLQTEGN